MSENGLRQAHGLTVMAVRRGRHTHGSPAGDFRVEAGDLARLDAAYSRTSPSSDDTAYLSRRIGELELRARR